MIENKVFQILKLIICCLLFAGPIHAQEVLVPAGSAAYGTQRAKKSAQIDTQPDTLELPFFDDFARHGNLPHTPFWIDEYAFINTSYTVNPVTIGVATMDAIYSDGSLNGTGSIPFESDFLTSAPINLDYPGRTDIYLSFFYEPMGLGDVPEAWDSLTVEFFAPDSARWETVWHVPGSANSTFQEVFIQVSENRFLKKGFQFRFKNYASHYTLSKPDQVGNVDHWHLDYVYLDTARSSNVTAINDVSMISPMPSILKNYEAIPWQHFPRAYLTELKPTLEIRYRNNDTTVRNVTRILKITDLAYHETDSVNGGAVNVQPGVLNVFNFPYNYPFIFYDADSTVFEIMSYLVTEDLDYKYNDTVIRFQQFFNYYAYDDGSAENGYGLIGSGSANASVAYQFNTFRKDTLRGVKMFFNRTYNDASQDYFRIGVWDHDKTTGSPGELIYASNPVKPQYENELNAFVTYEINDTLLVLSGEYYVGWIKTTERMLNVGFDRNMVNNDKIFYNLGQGWQNSGFSGSLMIRPIMGKALPAEPTSSATLKAPDIQLQIYPNPANTFFSLDLQDIVNPAEWSVSLYDLQGKSVYINPADLRQHPISHLPTGIYILRLDHDGIFKASRKLLIVR
jgi:hypothetical protein